MFLVTRERLEPPAQNLIRNTVVPFKGDNRILGGQEERFQTQTAQRFLFRSSYSGGIRATSDPDMVKGVWQASLPKGSGTWVDPFTWDMNCESGRMSSYVVTTFDTSVRRAQVFFAVKFLANVKYRIGTHYVSGDQSDMYMYLWEPDAEGWKSGGSNGRLAYDDDSNWTVNGKPCNAAFEYTSATDRMLIVGPGCYRDYAGTQLTLEFDPAPGILQYHDLTEREI
jgi:hypothetical protein